MKLLKRNLTEFEYMAYLGKTEVTVDDKHTGRWTVQYGDPVVYHGMIDVPTGYVQNQLFGINTDYSHVLLLDDPDADIKEAGRIRWKNALYEIKAVRQSLNVLSVALKKLTATEQG